jgi:hypothetical protein
LQDGEAPDVEVGDYCIGIWHNLSGNETTNADDGKGNFKYKGFTTIYFYVKAVTSDGVVTFSLRGEEGSSSWSRKDYPVAGMHFAVYANKNTKTNHRGNYTFITPDYLRHIEGADNWEFSWSNVRWGLGDNSNLSAFATESGNASIFSSQFFFINGDIFYSGRLMQYENGTQVEQIILESQSWLTLHDAGTAMIRYHVYSYDGRLWLCLTNGATDTPSDDSSNWRAYTSYDTNATFFAGEWSEQLVKDNGGKLKKNTLVQQNNVTFVCLEDTDQPPVVYLKFPTSNRNQCHHQS